MSRDHRTPVSEPRVHSVLGWRRWGGIYRGDGEISEEISEDVERPLTTTHQSGPTLWFFWCQLNLCFDISTQHQSAPNHLPSAVHNNDKKILGMPWLLRLRLVQTLQSWPKTVDAKDIQFQKTQKSALGFIPRYCLRVKLSSSRKDV